MVRKQGGGIRPEKGGLSDSLAFRAGGSARRRAHMFGFFFDETRESGERIRREGARLKNQVAKWAEGLYGGRRGRTRQLVPEKHLPPCLAEFVLVRFTPTTSIVSEASFAFLFVMGSAASVLS